MHGLTNHYTKNLIMPLTKPVAPTMHILGLTSQDGYYHGQIQYCMVVGTIRASHICMYVIKPSAGCSTKARVMGWDKKRQNGG
jgi:hypothetical protein